jgi:hypothetical protein
LALGQLHLKVEGEFVRFSVRKDLSVLGPKAKAPEDEARLKEFFSEACALVEALVKTPHS